VALCDRVLTDVGVLPLPDWAAAYGTTLVGDSASYAADVPVVAAALLDRRWVALGGRRLTEVLPWSAQHEQDAHAVAAAFLGGAAVPVAFDVRRWVAAATHAYRQSPGTYTALDLDAAMGADVDNHPAVRKRSSRSPRAELVERAALAGPGGPADALREADRSAGAALAERLELTEKRTR
jgi:hypothetical protein